MGISPAPQAGQEWLASVDLRWFGALDPLVRAKATSSLTPPAIDRDFPSGVLSNATGDAAAVQGPALPSGRRGTGRLIARGESVRGPPRQPIVKPTTPSPNAREL